MSLVKLAWATPGAQTAVQSELGKLKGGIANGWQRSSSAISQHKQHLGNVAELRAAKEHHALQKGKVGESDAVARLEKARAKVHETSNKLRESINPSGKSGEKNIPLLVVLSKCSTISRSHNSKLKLHLVWFIS